MEKYTCKKGPNISRNTSVGYYYERSSEGVPFKWEMQPGTPIKTQPQEIVPPLSPPPAMLNYGLSKPSFSVEEPKQSVLLKLRNWKHLPCKRYFSRFTNKKAEEEEMRRHFVLAKPFSLEDEKEYEHTTSNIIRRISSLFKNVRPGSDLTNFQLPPQMNLPRSSLQSYGEVIYSFGGHDLLGECSRRDLPIERLKSVVTWNISTLRPLVCGMSPYNPVLGETHHVSNGHINVLTEQVSHHPPVSALHATHEKENIDVAWCQYFTPKFRGSYVEVEVKGKRVMKLLNRAETYEMDQPKLIMNFLPPGAYWTGKIKIKCPETSLEAELNLISDSFIERFRGNNNRSIKGKIFESSSGHQLYDIFGHWDRTVTAKNLKTGELEVIYNAKENITRLKPPTVKNLKEVMKSESAIVWSEVSEGILKKEWDRASKAKRAVEEKQRESLKQREASRQSWVPKHFSVVKDGKDWDCTPLQPTVPRAPLIITEALGEIVNQIQDSNTMC
ncbi:Oxysterol-binding protein-related protein 4B [Cardamine amara subsp. amara]|uniref:Oxysterol-binding protein-related protein 4B n=1 Tax=Cardamine amara subsp. amara TaxID=228776 RepID=A0ABD1AFV7_CARAN